MVRRSKGVNLQIGSPQAPALSLSGAYKKIGRHPLDRSAQAPIERVATADPHRNSRPDPNPSGGTRVCARPIDQDVCDPSRRPARGPEDRLAGFLSVHLRCQDSGSVSNDGLSESVAGLLGGICTNSVPLHVSRSQTLPVDPLYRRPHLPQGAPTSPSLANLCAYHVDCRLARFAKAVGAQYTRYADDLAFSGDASFERCAERFSIHVAGILLDEGFSVNHRKTRIMRQGVPQRLAGLVANQRLNVARTAFDLLKATLTNCARLGPVTQNRESHPRFREHLEGRVGFVESVHPAKGARLRAIFEQIEW